MEHHSLGAWLDEKAMSKRTTFTGPLGPASPWSWSKSLQQPSGQPAYRKPPEKPKQQGFHLANMRRKKLLHI
jgi:hypothetical protein